MNQFFRSAVLVMAGFILLSAQQPSAPPAAGTTTFSSRAELVLVPVVVTDGHGHHIAGLKKEAFRLEEDGKPQDVKIFEEVTATRAAGSAAPSVSPPSTASTAAPPAQGFSNYGPHDQRSRRMTILVLDLVNTPVLLQTRARKQLIDYLTKSLDPNEAITLVGINRRRLKQLHSFTTDTSVLIAALKQVKGELSATEMNDNDTSFADTTNDIGGATGNEDLAGISEFLQTSEDDMKAFFQRDATRRTLAALDQIGQAYATVPGRKTLVWVTAGFPFMINDPDAFAHMGLDMVDSYERTWRGLMSANIAVYPIDVQGLMPPDLNRPFAARSGPTPGGVGRHGTNLRGASGQPFRYDRHMQQMDSMRAFAAATGGNPCLNNNDIAGCLQKAVADASAYYVVGFYLRPEDRKPGWRKLKVHVAADAAHIRARDGFYVGEPPKDEDAVRKLAIQTALSSPIEFTGIRLNVQWTSRVTIKNGSGEKLDAGFDVNLPPDSFTIDRQNSNAVDLLIAAVAFDKNGKPVSDMSRTLLGKLKPESLDQISHNGFTYQGSVGMPKTATEVRFVVRDNRTGEIGSVVAPIDTK